MLHKQSYGWDCYQKLGKAEPRKAMTIICELKRPKYTSSLVKQIPVSSEIIKIKKTLKLAYFFLKERDGVRGMKRCHIRLKEKVQSSQRYTNLL